MYEAADAFGWTPDELFALTVPQLLAILYKGKEPPKPGIPSFSDTRALQEYYDKKKMDG